VRVTILVDNNTLIDRYYLAEPGFSVLVEDGGARVLFDLGYSGIFLGNARKMGIDLAAIDCVALSHGHLDHSWGLAELIRHYSELGFSGRKPPRPRLVAHPSAFRSIAFGTVGEIGSLIPEGKLARHFDMSLGEEPQWLGANLVFLGSIPRLKDYETPAPIGNREGDGLGDRVEDDSALACRTGEGLVVITGCSHSGICNVIERAKAVTGESRLRDVIGGFHLQAPPRPQLEGTVDYFRTAGARIIHPCHCTDLASKIELARAVGVGEVGVGTVLEYL
jgi:7,8-dihydropterin-6-yl-methyl-4-(beta-D-ribofuranosyl)aminobenzene 5'-phosphate synthase